MKSEERKKTSKPSTLKPSTLKPSTPIEDTKKRARKILAALRKLYPEADCALRHADPFQLLIATILSAQSTDVTVNKVTPVLFKKYKTARALAGAPRESVEEIVHATGFFRQKTKSIQGACRKIVDNFGGKVPSTMDELVTLPGVARPVWSRWLFLFYVEVSGPDIGNE